MHVECDWHLSVPSPQTTILAATFDGGVVIGSDSRASIGGWVGARTHTETIK